MRWYHCHIQFYLISCQGHSFEGVKDIPPLEYFTYAFAGSEKPEACMMNEAIQTGVGKKLLTTYKSPLYDVDGSIMGTIGVGVDMTKEREYERKIVEKNQTLKMLFSTMDCGVMCHSLDGKRITNVNKAACGCWDICQSRNCWRTGSI